MNARTRAVVVGLVVLLTTSGLLAADRRKSRAKAKGPEFTEAYMQQDRAAIQASQEREYGSNPLRIRKWYASRRAPEWRYTKVYRGRVYNDGIRVTTEYEVLLGGTWRQCFRAYLLDHKHKIVNQTVAIPPEDAGDDPDHWVPPGLSFVDAIRSWGP